MQHFSYLPLFRKYSITCNVLHTRHSSHFQKNVFVQCFFKFATSNPFPFLYIHATFTELKCMPFNQDEIIKKAPIIESIFVYSICFNWTDFKGLNVVQPLFTKWQEPLHSVKEKKKRIKTYTALENQPNNISILQSLSKGAGDEKSSGKPPLLKKELAYWRKFHCRLCQLSLLAFLEMHSSSDNVSTKDLCGNQYKKRRMNSVQR